MIQTGAPASLHLPPPVNIRNISFGQILRHLGLADEPFYILDSKSQRPGYGALRPYKTSDCSLLFVESGDLTLRHGVQVFPLQTGSLLLKPPGTVIQALHFHADTRIRIFGFTEQLIANSGVHKRHLESLSLFCATTGPHLPLPPAEAATFSSILDILQAKSALKTKPPLYMESVSQAFGMIALEVASFQSRQHQQQPAMQRSEHLAYEFLKLVPQHITRERSVQFYADRLNVTAKYLSRCVKDVTGKTCGAIIDEMVILEARVLLDDPELSVAQVADQLHFANPFFFSRFFKDHTGLSPKAYRLRA